MITQPQIPQFATEAWYRNPSDHRCPHDAWLDAVEVRELAEGARHERRRSAITIRLVGAYHDGHIVFRYSGVTRFAIDCDASAGGVGDWIRDEFSTSDAGLLEHRISWCRGTSSEAEWFIEAEDVSYEWIPNEA
jgi:hypothetical protein